MRYVTHQFAHSETLERAHRWLIHAGIAPDRMQVRRQGVPRLAVSAEPGEVDSIEMVISAAEMADPDGLPSFWDVARLEPLYQDLMDRTNRLAAPSVPPRSFSPGNPLMLSFRRMERAATWSSRERIAKRGNRVLPSSSGGTSRSGRPITREVRPGIGR